MARGRRQTSLGISLFAFQDIIISVTGVLILIVLLLVLELVNQSPVSAVADHLKQLAQEMQSELDFLTSEVNLLEQQLQQDNALIEQVIANPESQLNRRLLTAEQRQQSLKTRIESLESIDRSLAEELAQQDETQDHISQLQAEIAVLSRRQQHLLDRLANIQQQKATRYLTPRGIHPEQAWLCEANGTGLHLSLLEENSPAIHLPVRNWENENAKAFSNLKAKLTEITPRVRYVLFIVRPSGREINDSLLIHGRQLQTEFGVEYVAEDHVILR